MLCVEVRAARNQPREIFSVRMLITNVLLLATVVHTHAEPCTFDGVESDFHGYRQVDFDFNGRNCKVVCPEVAAPGRPWVWRARFWGHEPQTDVALLREGFHVAYTDVAGLYGNPAAVAIWSKFHAYLTGQKGFSTRPALEAMSRGGLIAYNWAKANPEQVACIYVDAPVCDIKSWPGGLGVGEGSEDDWRQCLDAYGLTPETVLEFRGNPIDGLEPMARAGVPVLAVCGAADDVVPMAENTDILAERYRTLGGSIQVISKAGVGHHPHSLTDPAPIVDFILAHADPFARDYFDLRRGLANSGAVFTHTKKGRVAFLGGSITEMDGWRNLTQDELRRRFPDTEFDFIDAGISSTDSTLAAFRLASDVFARGPVDLLFMDHSVNDRHNNRTSEERVRGVEGIIRHAHALNPNIDIIVQYFVEPFSMDLLNQGLVPPVIADHDRVTRYLDIPAIDLAREVTERIREGDFTWEQFRDLHPSPFGHAIYATRIAKAFDMAWNGVDLAEAPIRPHTLNPIPLDPLNYGQGAYLPPDAATIVSGWRYIPAWHPADSAGTRKQFVGVPALEATSAGAALTLDFEGTAVGILVTAGPDVGMLDYTIDGRPYPLLDQFTEWSAGLHIPWAYMLAADLAPGRHRLELRTATASHERSRGTACRIEQFLVNGAAGKDG
jgi:pimeloyl-ACP methyl ester carboxylesterase